MSENDANQIALLEKQIIDLSFTLGQVEDLLRVLAQPLVEKHLSLMFDSHKQLRAYELTNGIRGAREIGNLVGIGKNIISKWWQEWFKLGIVVKEGNKYKGKYSLFDLMTIYSKQSWLTEKLDEGENK